MALSLRLWQRACSVLPLIPLGSSYFAALCRALCSTRTAALQAEKYLRSSGLRWTIVRPGGLSNDEPEAVGNLVVGAEDTFLGAESDPGRQISRTTVCPRPGTSFAHPHACL